MALFLGGKAKPRRRLSGHSSGGSIVAAGSNSGETYRAIAQVRLYIEKQGLPFQRKKDGSSEWVIPQEIWHSEVCKGLNSTFVAKTLCDRKMLLRSKEGFTMVRKVQGHDARAYVVTPKIFDESSEA